MEGREMDKEKAEGGRSRGRFSLPRPLRVFMPSCEPAHQPSNPFCHCKRPRDVCDPLSPLPPCPPRATAPRTKGIDAWKRWKTRRRESPGRYRHREGGREVLAQQSHMTFGAWPWALASTSMQEQPARGLASWESYITRRPGAPAFATALHRCEAVLCWLKGHGANLQGMSRRWMGGGGGDCSHD